MDTDNLKLGEVEILIEALQCKTLREVARRHNCPPAHISKQLQRLEQKVGKPLLVRSSQGVEPTAELKGLLPLFHDIFKAKQELEGQSQTHQHTLAIASSSFLNDHLIPLLIQRLDLKTPVRLLEVAPQESVNHGIKSHFNICLHTHELPWPQTWFSEQVGTLTWSLYANKQHPFAKLKKLTKKQILSQAFITPIHWDNSGCQYGNDLCPVPINQRTKGHEVTTAGTAAELLKVCEQLAFIPEIATRGHNHLKKLPEPWENVNVPVYLSVKSDSLKQAEFLKMQKALINLLKRY